MSSKGTLVFAMGAALFVSACGFDNALTSRGFLKEGDAICGETVFRTGVELDSRGSVGYTEFYGSLGDAYADAARRFEDLASREEDEDMQARTVSGFRRLSEELNAASSADSAAAPAAGRDAFEQAERLFTQLRGYGFDLCGGRDPVKA